MEEQGIKKRVRDDGLSEGESDPVIVKRLREDFLFILDDVDPDQDVQDELFAVMKSLEEEISAPSTPSHAPEPAVVVDLTADSSDSRPELGYLLEASDDELGLPPISVAVETPAATEEKELESVSNTIGSFGPSEMFSSDTVCPYDELEFGFYESQEYISSHLDFGNSLLDYADVSCDITELFDVS